MKKRPMVIALGVSVIIAAGFALGAFLLGQRPAVSFLQEKIGVIEVRGVITSSEKVLKALDSFRLDNGVAAIVLRVESPGGGVAPSQEIYREIQRAKRKKPVVCSMGAIAASGGYYIAAPCSRIIASPGTLTGSIGAIMTLPDVEELLGKIGIKYQILQAGSLKAAGQPFKPLAPDERAMLQQSLDEIHTQFIEDVARARSLDKKKVRRLATGGIFTGKKAMELGLVDEMGNLRDAVMAAAKLAGVKGRPEIVKPRDDKGSWISKLLESQARALISELAARLGHIEGASFLYRPGAAGGP